MVTRRGRFACGSGSLNAYNRISLVVDRNAWPGGSQGAVAYWAHIGGFAAGAALIYLFPHRKPPQRPARSVTGRFFDGEADFEI